MRRMAVVMAGALTGCVQPTIEEPDSARRRCPQGVVDNYMAARWQQCWFDATHGPWRTLTHDFHYDVLVVDAEAADPRDAAEIAGRFVGVHGSRFQEILVYLRPLPAAGPSPTQRVRWTNAAGFETLTFQGSR